MSATTVEKKQIKASTRSLNQISPTANAIMHVILIIACLLVILPLLIVIAASFSEEKQIVTYGYSFLPRGFSLEAYKLLFTKGKVVYYAYRNTIAATVLGTVCCMVSVGLYAYPLSRRDFRFRGVFMFISFFTMLFNAGMVPYYVTATQILGLKNTFWALFLPMSFSAYWVIIMRTFYRTNVPEEVIESARIDGAGEWRTLLQIVVPLAIPGLATVALYATIGIWNNFYQCLLLNSDDKLTNLQYMIYRTLMNIRYLKEMAAQQGIDSNQMMDLANLPSETFRMAMALITIGPIVAAYPYFQRFFMKGLTIGAVKG